MSTVNLTENVDSVNDRKLADTSTLAYMWSSLRYIKINQIVDFELLIQLLDLYESNCNLNVWCMESRCADKQLSCRARSCPGSTLRSRVPGCQTCWRGFAQEIMRLAQFTSFNLVDMILFEKLKS